jgi:hypothetical protein
MWAMRTSSAKPSTAPPANRPVLENRMANATLGQLVLMKSGLVQGDVFDGREGCRQSISFRHRAMRGTVRL